MYVLCFIMLKCMWRMRENILDTEKQIEHIVQYYIYMNLCINVMDEWFEWRKYAKIKQNTNIIHIWVIKWEGK